MLSIIRDLLLKIVADIDAGNSTLTEEEATQLVKSLKRYTKKDVPISKYQAAKQLNISVSTFDNYVREGKLPAGRKVEGFKEKFWLKKDLNIKK